MAKAVKKAVKEKAEAKTIIDVDVIINNFNEEIDRYNAENPTLRQKERMTKRSLAEILGVNPQILSDWKAGKTPNVVARLFKLMELGKCELKDFITIQAE